MLEGSNSRFLAQEIAQHGNSRRQEYLEGVYQEQDTESCVQGQLVCDDGWARSPKILERFGFEAHLIRSECSFSRQREILFLGD